MSVLDIIPSGPALSRPLTCFNSCFFVNIIQDFSPHDAHFSLSSWYVMFCMKLNPVDKKLFCKFFVAVKIYIGCFFVMCFPFLMCKLNTYCLVATFPFKQFPYQPEIEDALYLFFVNPGIVPVFLTPSLFGYFGESMGWSLFLNIHDRFSGDCLDPGNLWQRLTLAVTLTVTPYPPTLPRWLRPTPETILPGGFNLSLPAGVFLFLLADISDSCCAGYLAGSWQSNQRSEVFLGNRHNFLFVLSSPAFSELEQ